MSIDYDRLRDALTAIDNPKADKIARRNHTVSLRLRAPDTARELIRLHDELTDLRDTMHAHAELLRGESRPVAADYAHRLTRILNGDTE